MIDEILTQTPDWSELREQFKPDPNDIDDWPVELKKTSDYRAWLYHRRQKRRIEYRIYLRSAHWKWLRNQALNRDDHKCTGCGWPGPGGLEVHHVMYRENWVDCTVGDVKTLCILCHEEEHDK